VAFVLYGRESGVALRPWQNEQRCDRPDYHDYVCRSSYLHEADLVANELERLGIAFYPAQESPLGVRGAMPL
jgi:hypothetical protein